MKPQESLELIWSFVKGDNKIKQKEGKLPITFQLSENVITDQTILIGQTIFEQGVPKIPHYNAQ